MKYFVRFLPALLCLALLGCNTEEAASTASSTGATEAITDTDLSPITHTEVEWREKLTAEQFYILREAGTERPFSSRLLQEKRRGVFVCAGCDLPLFDARTKFDSGSGWPSFWAPIALGHVVDKQDVSLGMIRVENLCGRCGGHLGHVFEDEPRPTGLRYCINGDALKFVPTEGAK